MSTSLLGSEHRAHLVTQKPRRSVVKPIITSLLITLNVIASPAFARNGSRGAAYDQGSVYQGYSKFGDQRSADDQRIISSISRNDWSAGQ